MRRRWENPIDGDWFELEQRGKRIVYTEKPDKNGDQFRMYYDTWDNAIKHTVCGAYQEVLPIRKGFQGLRNQLADAQNKWLDDKGYTLDKLICQHEYKEYIGFTHIYKYCIKCDNKA